MRVGTFECLWVYVYTSVRLFINECIEKMDLNRRGRQTEELISLSKVYTSSREKLLPPPSETTIKWFSRQW